MCKFWNTYRIILFRDEEMNGLFDFFVVVVVVVKMAITTEIIEFFMYFSLYKN
jgi:hypothetical protein